MTKPKNKYQRFLDHERRMLKRLDHDKVEILRGLWEAVPEKYHSFRDKLWGSSLGGWKHEEQPRTGGFYTWFWGRFNTLAVAQQDNPPSDYCGHMKFYGRDLSEYGCRSHKELRRKILGIARAWRGTFRVRTKMTDSDTLYVSWYFVG